MNYSKEIFLCCRCIFSIFFIFLRKVFIVKISYSNFLRSIKILLIIISVSCSIETGARDILFCGEPIPITDDFVAEKLMNVIRSQIPNVNIMALRQQALKYFPYIESCLRKNGIPEDFKYLPIIESGFANLSSNAGARGFWQLMPADARDFNLKVTSETDERDDPLKATVAACKLIIRNYNNIKRCNSRWYMERLR